MNLLSRDNSFYRYSIATPDDLSESCFLRRQLKAKQNNRQSFFYEISPGFSDPNLFYEFIRTKATVKDLVCVSFELYTELPESIRTSVNTIVKISSRRDLRQFAGESIPVPAILFAPLVYPDLAEMVEFLGRYSRPESIYWLFSPYRPEVKSSLTVKDICSFPVSYQTISGLEIYNHDIPHHYELQPLPRSSYRVEWQFRTPEFRPAVSVIIPTYNNSSFLSNVIWHLTKQDIDPSCYEMVIVDDGSTDRSSVIIQELLSAFKDKVNLTYIYWSKDHPSRGSQEFFRPGLARNLGCRHSSGKYLTFLDSDMLVPAHFIKTCIQELSANDIVQFQRFHIHQNLSRNNPQYRHIQLHKDTYIEEKNYWSQLFFCNHWSELPYHWKYTCTYALALKKEDFIRLGMFKKYYISYGFEDTDLGYEAHKRNYRFSLAKVPLLHLTSYDQMQYKNSSSHRLKLLRVTAELFFLQHLDRNVYSLLGNFYRSQKPVRAYFRDLLP